MRAIIGDRVLKAEDVQGAAAFRASQPNKETSPGDIGPQTTSDQTLQVVWWELI